MPSVPHRARQSRRLATEPPRRLAAEQSNCRGHIPRLGVWVPLWPQAPAPAPRLARPACCPPLVVINVGTGPAFDLSVRWSENPAGDLLARTPMLGVNGRLEWSVPVGPGSDENQTIRRLWLDWCDSRSRRLVGHPAPCRACAIDAGPDAVVRYSSRTVVRVKLQHK